jgi:4-amino-4-deoxy-L-arabinose transferase-like glycosyltransferase
MSLMIPSKISNQHVIAILLLYLLLVTVSLLGRSYIPVDETRYVTVAWNMWLHGDYLVPHLNGEAYSHKPPLLFWLMNLGWKVFGVNDWWPRLVPSFFALGSVLLTLHVARRLWPEKPQVAGYAGLILTGNVLWMVFMTATMFDMLVAFFTLLGIFGILLAWQEKSFKGWVILGFAIGGGLLAKGPTILLQTLPLAALAPWWVNENQPDWRRWYAGVGLAILLGAAIALLWAIPAGMHGGPKYQHEIFWGQTAERMVHSFAHRRPNWWYLETLPLILAPWLFTIPTWRGLIKLPALLQESALRLCLAWLVPVFLAFSMISGKQMQYLLPILPAFALLAARGLDSVKSVSWLDRAVLLLVGSLAGAMLLALPIYAEHHALASWFSTIPAWGGIILIISAILLFLWPDRTPSSYILRVTIFSALFVSMAYLAVIRHAGPAYDIREISGRIKTLQDEGKVIANAGKYYGQYDFVGRLTVSPEVVTRSILAPWFASHPDGRAIVAFDKKDDLMPLKLEYQQSYRGGQLGILTADQWQAWLALSHGKDLTPDEEDSAD